MFSPTNVTVIKAEKKDDYWKVEFEVQTQSLLSKKIKTKTVTLLAKQIGQWRFFETWREINPIMMDFYDAAFLKWQNEEKK